MITFPASWLSSQNWPLLEESMLPSASSAEPPMVISIPSSWKGKMRCSRILSCNRSLVSLMNSSLHPSLHSASEPTRYLRILPLIWIISFMLDIAIKKDCRLFNFYISLLSLEPSLWSLLNLCCPYVDMLAMEIRNLIYIMSVICWQEWPHTLLPHMGHSIPGIVLDPNGIIAMLEWILYFLDCNCLQGLSSWHPTKPCECCG